MLVMVCGVEKVNVIGVYAAYVVVVGLSAD
jgi:hypothetical protein